jgi:cell division transport system ATP-binding protein
VDEGEIRERVSEMIAWVGLSGRASARPATLSGGEQQRVAIARAVINRPELIIADEPTGNVDAEMANRLMGLFTALNRLGTTVIVATHDVGLINATAGAQLIRLENGTLVDPTGTLKNPPRPPRGSACCSTGSSLRRLSGACLARPPGARRRRGSLRS